MKKAIVGFAAVGAVVGLWPAVKRMSTKMRKHCIEMAAKCKQTAGAFGGRHERVGRA